MIRIAGKYEIIKKLGQGAFGEVFLVKPLDLNVHYALKLLKVPSLQQYNHLPKEMQDHYSEKLQYRVQRFKREAEVLSRFIHPRSVQLRDFGRTPEGHFYMVMDYSDGKPLSVLMKEEGPLSQSRVLFFTSQILEVLKEAHQKGIIHRDLKPDNLMIETDQEGLEWIKVLDFGIAKLKLDLKDQISLTREGEMLGTPLYMSPEQITGDKEIDGRADFYSLGMIMYEMLSGVVPLKGDTSSMTLQLQLSHYPVPFGELKSSHNISPAVERIVFKGIHKKKEERFSSAEEFQRACQKAQKALSTPSSTKYLKYKKEGKLSSTFSRSFYLLGGGAVALLALVLSVFFFWPSSSQYPHFLGEAKKALALEKIQEAEKLILQALSVKKTEEAREILDRIHQKHYNNLILEAHRAFEQEAYGRAQEKAQEARGIKKTLEVQKLLDKLKKRLPKEKVRERRSVKKTAQKVPSHPKYPHPSVVAMFRGGPALQGIFEDSSPPPKGLIQWKFPGNPSNPPIKGTGIYSTPAVVGDSIYFAMVQNLIVALNRKTQKVEWQLPIQGRSLSSPAIEGNMLFIGDEKGYLYGIQRGRGILKWQYHTGTDGRVNVGVYTSPIVHKGVVYFGVPYYNYEEGHLTAHSGNLFALESSSGEVLWKVNLSGPMRGGTPAMEKDRVYIVFLIAGGAALRAYNLKGETLWTTPLLDSYYQKNPRFYCCYSSPAISDGRIYISNYLGMVYCADAQKGNLLWKNRIINSQDLKPHTGFWISSPAVQGKTLWIGSLDGHLYSLDSQTGKKIWSFSTGAPIFCSPIVSQGRVYFGGRSGYLYSLDGQRGTLLWKVKLGSWIEGSLSLQGGEIFLGALGGKNKRYLWSVR